MLIRVLRFGLTTGARLTTGVRHVSNVPRVRKTAYHVFDHDGCIGEANIDPEDIPAVHKDLVEHILEQKREEGYTESFAACGSNRQSIRLDALNALRNQNNLSAPVLDAIARAIGAWHDPLRLSDITVDKKAGFNLSKLRTLATQQGVKLNGPQVSDAFLNFLLSVKHNPPGFLYSIDKTNLLYAFAHRAGSIQGRVDIHFYDDLVNDVIKPAATFYKRNPSLLPSNVRLHFHHYATQPIGECSMSQLGPQLPSLITKVKGEGQHDPDYYNTVRRMSEIAREEEGQQSSYELAKYLTPKRLFRPPTCAMADVANRVLHSIGLFSHKTPAKSPTNTTQQTIHETPLKK